jgi:hypothetical protein
VSKPLNGSTTGKPLNIRTTREKNTLKTHKPAVAMQQKPLINPFKQLSNLNSEHSKPRFAPLQLLPPPISKRTLKCNQPNNPSNIDLFSHNFPLKLSRIISLKSQNSFTHFPSPLFSFLLSIKAKKHTTLQWKSSFY